MDTTLGSRYPSDWHVVSKRAGDREDRRQEAERLTSVLSYTIDCERENLERENRIDFWFFSLRATFLALTCDNPRMVEQAYREAVAYAPRYTEESMRRGLEMYRTLGVEHFNSAIRLQENVDCALAVIRGDEQASRTPPNVVLFAGLRMEPQSYTVPDTAEDGGMKTMRYLPPQAKDWARDQIKAALQREKAKLEAKGQPGARLIGLAAGSSGADLLFHDTCHDLDIETRMYLALPKDQYVGQYVSEAGPDWVESFNAVYARLHTAHNDYTGDCVEREVESPIHVLAENDELPRWLQSLDNYSIGRRTEVWMLQHALVQRSMHGSGTEVTLIVLWAKNKARSGGLHHLVELAARNGVKVLTIDCAQWDKDQPAPKADAAKA